jgi:hypothetical protein
MSAHEPPAALSRRSNLRKICRVCSTMSPGAVMFPVSSVPVVPEM